MFRDIIEHTPYINLHGIDRPDIFIKLECDQFSNSFKSRGIVSFLSGVETVNGLVTYTTGNHGIALAAIAKALGVKAIIVSSDKLSAYKRTVIEGYGATIHPLKIHGVDMATQYAKDLAEKMNYTFVPLFDNASLLDGYSQITNEIFEDFPGQQLALFFPIGSGSLLLANARRAKEIDPANIVYGVEPHIFQRLGATRQQDKVSQSIADSLSIDKIPHSNLELLQYADEIIPIEEDAMIESTKLIHDQYGLITEPSGAITLAAALTKPYSDIKKIAVITGKNISKEHFELITSAVKEK